LLIRQTDGEALIVEFHEVAQGCRGAVMKIRSTRRQASQGRSLELAYISALAGDRGTTNVGDLKDVAGQGPSPC
jgi:hypothetical protein